MLAEFVEESKKEKSISDLLVMALPERVVAGLTNSSSSSIKERVNDITPFVCFTRVNAIIFILLITVAIAFTTVSFIWKSWRLVITSILSFLVLFIPTDFYR